jgi:hypothetical protein
MNSVYNKRSLLSDIEKHCVRLQAEAESAHSSEAPFVQRQVQQLLFEEFIKQVSVQTTNLENGNIRYHAEGFFMSKGFFEWLVTAIKTKCYVDSDIDIYK